jgi:hypothetical protein
MSHIQFIIKLLMHFTFNFIMFYKLNCFPLFSPRPNSCLRYTGGRGEIKARELNFHLDLCHLKSPMWVKDGILDSINTNISLNLVFPKSISIRSLTPILTWTCMVYNTHKDGLSNHPPPYITRLFTRRLALVHYPKTPQPRQKLDLS